VQNLLPFQASENTASKKQGKNIFPSASAKPALAGKTGTQDYDE